MKTHKYILFLLFITIISSINVLQANMSSPYIRSGENMYVGLNSKDINILKEDLIIKIHNHKEAEYNIVYHILNNKENGNLELVFDTYNTPIDFEVYLDNTPITIDKEAGRLIKAKDELNDLEERFVGFNLYIIKGEHQIKVTYRGTPDIFLGNWIKSYEYGYNLEPAKHWNSFGKLNFTIDATQTTNGKINVNIQDSIYNISNGEIKTWQFNSLPQDFFSISYSPQESKNFDYIPSLVFYSTLLGLFLLNLFILFQWRKKHLSNKYCKPAILGAILIPLITLLVYIFSYNFIDYIIGEHASRRHGYYFLVIIFYPFISIIYFLFIWIIDVKHKRRLKDSIR